MNTTSKFIAGAFSLILLGIIVVGPVYLSEKLEQLEVSANGDVVLRTEINSETTIIPYLEFNDTTKINGPCTYGWGPVGWGYRGLGTVYGESTMTSNFDTSTVDIIGPSADRDYTAWKQFIQIDSLEMSENEITQLTFWSNCSKSWYFYSLRYLIVNVGASTVDDFYDLIVGGGTPSTGEKTIEKDLSSYLPNMLSLRSANYQEETDAEILCITLQWDDGWTGNNMFYTDFQIGPEYYEIIEYDNSTVAVPFISTFSTYGVHKVSMGLGGLLIFCFGWLASPFNRYFDNFIPVNVFRRSRK